MQLAPRVKRKKIVNERPGKFKNKFKIFGAIADLSRLALFNAAIIVCIGIDSQVGFE